MIKKSYFLALMSICISGIISFCDKKENIVTQTEYNLKIKNAASTQGACNCQSNPCKLYDILFFCPCAKKILNDQNSRNFIVNWNTNCCGGGMSVSYGKVCYTGDKNELYVQLSNIPGCLYDCFGDVYCFRATIIKCTQHSFLLGGMMALIPWNLPTMIFI